MTKKKTKDERLNTGVRNLDAVLNGGFPLRSITVIGGHPGSGKTTLTQQICFHNASPKKKVLYFQTLSEPTAKTLRYLQQFNYFDKKKLDDGSVEFVDLGGIMRLKGLEQTSAKMMEHMKRVRPQIVVIDSFKVFNDLANNREELRKFAYEMVINLMTWECTGFLLGEFSEEELQQSPLSSIVDGIIMMTAKETSGEQQRFIQVQKMRGTDHSQDSFPLVLNDGGVEIYSPRVTIRRDAKADAKGLGSRVKTGIKNLDSLLGSDIPSGSSLLISGVTGTGKTLLALEAIYRGAKEFNEKGLFISFEETEERLLASARSLGWNLKREIERGMIEILFIPQTDILVERDLLLIQERIELMKAKRIAIDSISVFMYKIDKPIIAREKTYQLATLIQKAGALGLLTTDVPFGSNQISKFGVEETVVDGIILLTSTKREHHRDRTIEVYKMRNSDHQEGDHSMSIEKNGIAITLRSESNANKGKKIKK
jgi:circadian clock protein KaiC